MTDANRPPRMREGKRVRRAGWECICIMTAPFYIRELRRLSEANKPGPWGHSRSGYVFTGGGDAVCRTDVRDTDEDAGPLIAYLGTHRDAILRMLEAADALAEALQVGPMCAECRVFLRPYMQETDTYRCAHSIKASEARTKDALAAYKKARGE